MNSIPRRFSEAPLDSYTHDKIYVNCPKCHGVAIVFGAHSFHWLMQAAEIACISCSYTKNYEHNPQEWYGYVSAHPKFSKSCPNCGCDLPIKSSHGSNLFGPGGVTGRSLEALITKKWRKGMLLPERASIFCKNCKQKVRIEIKWWRTLDANYLTDPYFGLPLFLVTDCVDKKLWVYNEQHLMELKQYIEALNRPPSIRHIRKSFPNLPPWIKAKNKREKILRCLDKLQEKLSAIQIRK
jgi:hypothetical protein